MMIPPQPDLPATRLADWLELYALTTDYRACAVEKLWEAMELPENALDNETEDIEKENLLGKAYREIERRIESLDEAYPFRISDRGATIVCEQNLNPGMLAYLLSLRISIKSTGIVADGSFPDISPQERNLFQACANLAAAGYLGGRVYAFGWPRPDRTNLLEALKKVEQEMGGEGVVLDSPPQGAPNRPKDDELDVFAWLPHCDGPGWALTLWGQVASGQDWSNKSLSSDKIKQFRMRWYKKQPALEPIRAMFVPFCLFEEELDEGTEKYKATLIDRTIHYGIIFHRCRLPWCMQRAFDRPNEVEGTTAKDKQIVYNELKEWWEKFCQTLQAAFNADAA